MPKLNKDLRILNCSDNSLTCLPYLYGTQITTLDCSHNKLTYLPRFPYELDTLYCYNNLLERLPRLNDNLYKLYCGINRLTSLPILNKKLRHLIIIQNPIQNIIDNTNRNINIRIKIIVLRKFRFLYCCIKYKKQFRKWLWELREKKIKEQFHPKYLLDNLDNEDVDLDEVLENWTK